MSEAEHKDAAAQVVQELRSGASHAESRADSDVRADAWQVVHIHEGAPAKPALGTPCNGCGICCLVEPCPLGMVVSGKRIGACHALRWSDAESHYRCGMVDDPRAVVTARWPRAGRLLTPAFPLVRRLASRWISAGTGCDATFEAEVPPR